MKLDIRQNNFDLIRLFAALQVVIHHGLTHFGLQAELSALAWLSWFPGVPIFFVVSGFLISASFERNADLRTYAYNRFIRIFPGLWVCFIVSAITVALLHSVDASAAELIRWVFTQLTVGQFYNPEFLRSYGVGVLNGSLWTIPVELQFYLILPLLYVALNASNWNRLVIVFLMLVLVLINQVYYYYSYAHGEQGTLAKLFGVTLLPYLYFFIIGIFLQKHFGVIRQYLANRFHYVLAAYLLSVYVLSQFSLPVAGNFVNPLSALLLALLVISAAFSFTQKLAGLTKGYDISYGVYIYHMIIINALVQHSKFPPQLNLMITLVLTIVIAAASWKYVESPCLKTKRVSIKAASTVNHSES